MHEKQVPSKENVRTLLQNTFGNKKKGLHVIKGHELISGIQSQHKCSSHSENGMF